MEESWINLTAGQARQEKPARQHSDEIDEVLSGPSTASSTSSSSSTSSLGGHALTGSGSTDENLSASFGTLLRKGEVDSAQQVNSSQEEKDVEKERRDTITAGNRPKEMSQERRRSRLRRRHEKAEAVKTSFWSGFYSGVSVGISTMLVGFACWRLTLRFRIFGAG